MSVLKGYIKRYALSAGVSARPGMINLEAAQVKIGEGEICRQLFFTKVQQLQPIISLKKSSRSSIGANINVYPDIVWLTESNDYSGNFEVSSNTDWTITY